MDDQGWRRLRGLTRLIHDGVRQGADFVEKHHRHAAEKPFRVLESIPPIAAPAKVVHGLHDGVLWLSYGGIRAINRAIEKADDWLVDQLAPDDDDHRPDDDAPPDTWGDSSTRRSCGAPRSE